MKLRLVFSMPAKSGKDVELKLNIAPSKHLGFSNFVNTAFKKKRPVKVYFEKVDTKGNREPSRIYGEFKFVAAETTKDDA